MPKSKLGSVLTVFGAAALAGVALLAMVLPSPREVTMKFWAGIPGALPPATDPTRPVARLPAVVTMAQAALADIEHDGAIRPPRPEEAERFIDAASARYRSKLSPDYRLPLRFDYAVTRLLALPFGLDTTNFLVLEGVPAPIGDRGFSCIAYMDGYRFERRDPCLRGQASGFEEADRLPSAESLSACRLWEPPAGASLEAVSAYAARGWEKTGRGRHPIAVRVEKPGDVVLVLNTYEPVAWRIEASPQTRIVGVLAIAYGDPGTVSGVSPNTPVKIVRQTSLVGTAPSSCAVFYAYFASAYEGGPHTILLARQVEALTGRTLDGLRGAQLLSEAYVR
ncbi:MAG: hypothetical protein ABWY66_06115 [Xanthobacteraceae bacterium]